MRSAHDASGQPTVASILAAWLEKLRVEDIPDAVVRACADTVIDTAGLCVAARNTGYVRALRQAWPSAGPCTVLGASETREAGAAALINGVAAHGEDFDNTFEGCPVHTGAVIVPAVLACAEKHQLKGGEALSGIAAGLEVMCRLGLVAKKGVHTAGFHPTSVLGTLGATAAVAAARRLPARVTINAFGIAGSLASGIIEYLADGSWTKRLHAGWSAHCGLRAAAMAEAGFTGPGSVFEGRHGLFASFAPSVSPDFDLLSARLGRAWQSENIAFKPYACGTMTQPFIDCAIRLSRRVRAEDVVSLTCSVGEGTVHRLWEPLAAKRRPPNAYAAKFSTPYCIAVSFLRGTAGLAEFGEPCLSDPRVLGLADRVQYRIDPANEYPRNYTGHIVAKLTDGSIVEERQPYLRGGRKAPLEREELLGKCRANLRHGGWNPARADAFASFADGLATSGKQRVTAVPGPAD